MSKRATGTRWLPSVLVGLVLALAFAALFAWRNADEPLAVVLVVFTLTTWPIWTVGWHVLVTDRRATAAQVEAGAENVETAWVTNAAATAFFTTMAGLVVSDTFGGALRVGWLSPVGLWHAVVIGGLAFAGAYLYERRAS